MGLWSRMVEATSRTALPAVLGDVPPIVEQKSIPVVPTPFWPPEVWSNPLGVRNSGPGLSRATAFAVSAYAYICIQKRADILSQAPPMVSVDTDDGTEWLDDHPLAEVLEHPNVDFPMERMLQLTSIYRDIWGTALWLKTRDNGKRTVRMYVFGGHEFGVESARDRLFGLFRVTTKAGQKEVGPEEVVFFPGIDPNDPLGAVSPLDVALRVMGLGEELRVASKAILSNAMAPSGVITIPESLGQREFEAMQGRVRQAHTGANRGSPLILTNGATWETTQMTLQEMMPSDLIAWIEATVCAVFGLHPALVGLKAGIENSPWSHLATAKKMLYDEMAVPRWAADARILTSQLLRDIEFRADHVIRFFTDEIPALQEDVAQNAEIAAKGLGYMTVNEKRAWMGYDPIAGPVGETIFVPSTWMPAEFLVDPPEPEPAPMIRSEDAASEDEVGDGRRNGNRPMKEQRDGEVRARRRDGQRPVGVRDS